ncbi:ABC transporter permease [Flavobacterium sp. N1718]|uniref:ABC transporter permease n=1 Tax=unclassified Flavobacterium TaxID=196869 RepID=UPI0029CABE36|nr:ABC transporter permease [Flavobacterium sp. N1718]
MSSRTWLFEITPRDTLLRLDLKEVWRYRDLLVLLVRRDLVAFYKQTILGPLWYVIQPILTTVIFTIIFNGIADIQTNGVPPFLFNLAGVTVWTFFSTCLTTTADTFKTNAALFGKVYFPRVIMPLSVVLSNLVKFLIQLVIFFGFYLYFYFSGVEIRPHASILLFPLLIISMALLGLGLGMIVSSLVSKYRDLSFLVVFGVQLLMYLSAVTYPIELVQQKLPQWAWAIQYNPLAHMVEISRRMLLGGSDTAMESIGMTIIPTVVVLFVGLLIFNKTERTFIDTI